MSGRKFSAQKFLTCSRWIPFIDNIGYRFWFWFLPFPLVLPGMRRKIRSIEVPWARQIWQRLLRSQRHKYVCKPLPNGADPTRMFQKLSVHSVLVPLSQAGRCCRSWMRILLQADYIYVCWATRKNKSSLCFFFCGLFVVRSFFVLFVPVVRSFARSFVVLLLSIARIKS